MDLLQFLTDSVTALAGSPWIFLLVFVVCVVDGFFPPVPSETIVVAAATISAATGAPHLVPLMAAAAAGAFAGDAIAFAIGRSVGVTRFAWMRRPRVRAMFTWARRGLDRRGAMAIFVARYIPIGRIAVNMSAGATGYPARRFIPISIAAGMTWAVYSSLFGLVAGKWLHEQPLLAAVLAVVAASVIGIGVDLVVRRVLDREPSGDRPSAVTTAGQV
ncbi:DedA family protein [Agromyces aerolatus]|uniref:DedA family protein n=1 Tax=Agromyces sp. LY-1074 TaxID=3074080 RepID=UPI00285B285A|nr:MULTISPECIES: VTT domain-containing protein [unclassified Agromyces]MDR5701295.1 VTT domain-containing protein [Agromyces sp. LY-1074]MDR5707553.1 VTT domain-containing protein [Agromyces sp. LY-1358]